MAGKAQRQAAARAELINKVARGEVTAADAYASRLTGVSRGEYEPHEARAKAAALGQWAGISAADKAAAADFQQGRDVAAKAASRPGMRYEDTLPSGAVNAMVDTPSKASQRAAALGIPMSEYAKNPAYYDAGGKTNSLAGQTVNPGGSLLGNVSAGNGLGAPMPQNAMNDSPQGYRVQGNPATQPGPGFASLEAERDQLTRAGNEYGGAVMEQNLPRILEINRQLNAQDTTQTGGVANFGFKNTSGVTPPTSTGLFSPTGQEFAGPTPVDMARQGGGYIPTATDAARDARFADQAFRDAARNNAASGESVFDPSLHPGGGMGGVGGVPIKEALEGPAQGTLAAQGSNGGLPVGGVVAGGTVAGVRGAQGDKTPDGKQTTAGPTGSSTGPGSGGVVTSPGGTPVGDTVTPPGGVPVGDVIPDGSTTPGSQNTNGGTTIPVPTGGGGTNVTIPPVVPPGGGGMDWGALIALLGSGAYGASQGKEAAQIQADAARNAATLQSEAAQRAMNLNESQFNATQALNSEMYNNQRTDQESYRVAGQNALQGLVDFDANNQQYTPDPFQFNTTGANVDPSYAWRLDQGMKALQNSAAAKGMLRSGNTMKAITDYGQGAASQEYSNAFNRYQTDTANKFSMNQANRGAKLNAMQSLAGVGQSAVQQVGQAGQNYANNQGQNSQNYSNNQGQYGMAGANAQAGGVTGAANANASGVMGASNAMTNSLSTWLNYNNQQNMTSALMSRR